jgi:hypothetical protein
VTAKRPSRSPFDRAERAADATSRTVRALAAEDLAERQEKTQRLRAERLARDADPGRPPLADPNEVPF